MMVKYGWWWWMMINLTGAFYAGNVREWSQSSLIIIPATPSPIHSLRKTHGGICVGHEWNRSEIELDPCQGSNLFVHAWDHETRSIASGSDSNMLTGAFNVGNGDWGLLGWLLWWLGSFPKIPCVKRTSKYVPKVKVSVTAIPLGQGLACYHLAKTLAATVDVAASTGHLNLNLNAPQHLLGLPRAVSVSTMN